MFTNEFVSSKVAFYLRKFNIQPAFSRNVLMIYDDLSSLKQPLGLEGNSCCYTYYNNDSLVSNGTQFSRVSFSGNVSASLTGNTLQIHVPTPTTTTPLIQAALAWRDENIQLAAPGVVKTINFTGNGVTASMSGASILEVNIPGGNDTENIQDTVADMFGSGTHTNATVTYNDTTGALSVAVPNVWKTTGNAGLDAGTHFIGTTDNVDVVFKRNNIQVAKFPSNATIILGKNAHQLSSANFNIAIGDYSLASNTSAEGNVAVGYAALYNNNGSNNNGFGNGALRYNTTGLQNVAIGGNALISNITGGNNTALGVGTDVSTSAQSYSTAIGAYAIVSTSNTIKLGRSLDDSVVIGQDGKVDSAKLAVVSTTQGFLPPVMTTAQRNAITSPATGLLLFNTTTGKLECYDGTTWQAAW